MKKRDLNVQVGCKDRSEYCYLKKNPCFITSFLFIVFPPSLLQTYIHGQRCSPFLFNKRILSVTMDRLQGLGFYMALPHPQGLDRVVPAPLQPQIEWLTSCLALLSGMGCQRAAHGTGAWKPPSHLSSGPTKAPLLFL